MPLALPLVRRLLVKGLVPAGLILVELAGTPPAAAQVDSEGQEGPSESSNESTEANRLRPIVRLTLDRSRLHWLRDHKVIVDSEETAAEFRQRQFETTPAWGGRVRAGAALAGDRDRGMQFYIEGAYGQTRSFDYSGTVVGEISEWRSRQAYWAAMSGAEGQFLRRILTFGASLGVAGVTGGSPETQDAGLSIESKSRWGLQGQVALGVHLPGVAGFHPGLEVFASGFVLPRHPLAPGATNRGTRLGVSLFFEWDGSR